jgi:uncharacterized membrane protein
LGVVGALVGVWLTTYGNRYPIFPDVGQWWFEWHDTVLRTAGTWLVGGAVLGLAFAALVAVAERGRAVHQLRRSRLAVWGAVAGLLFACAGLAGLLVGRSLHLQLVIAGLSGLPLVLVTLLGAACAGLTVWSAGRETPPQRQATLGGGTDAAEPLARDGRVPMVGERSGADVLTRR